MDKADILSFLSTHKQELHERFGLVSIALFGGYVSNEQSAHSDINLAIKIQSENKFRSFFTLKAYLEEALGCQVDLGIEGTLKPTIKERIKKKIHYL